MFRIEPASYMLALARALRSLWPGEIDVVFMGGGGTQDWRIDAADFPHGVLPEGQLAAMCAMRRRIHETRPGILQIAGWATPPSLVAILTGHARGLPVVVDLDTWRGTPSCWRGAVKRLIYPHLFDRVTHFGPGGSRQAAYLRSFDVPERKITAIHMTVDVNAIRRYLADEPKAGAQCRRRFGVAPDDLLVLFLGRLVSLKGLDDLLDAWPRVAARAHGARLVVAGEGVLRERIAEAAEADPSILPVGRLDGVAVWQALAAADFLVAPSHSEAWGLVVNEAMAAGTPCIVTDVFGCVGDLARDDETAIVIPAHAPDRLADAMIRLAAEPETRCRLAVAGSELVSDWTIEREAERVVEIWRRAMKIGA